MDSNNTLYRNKESNQPSSIKDGKKIDIHFMNRHVRDSHSSQISGHEVETELKIHQIIDKSMLQKPEHHKGVSYSNESSSSDTVIRNIASTQKIEDSKEVLSINKTSPQSKQKYSITKSKFIMIDEDNKGSNSKADTNYPKF